MGSFSNQAETIFAAYFEFCVDVGVVFAVEEFGFVSHDSIWRGVVGFGRS